MKRLDLDAAKSKQKKNKMLGNAPVAMADVSRILFLINGNVLLFMKFQSSDADVRHAQAEFERQYHITRLMLDGLNNSQVSIFLFIINKKKTEFFRIIM